MRNANRVSLRLAAAVLLCLFFAACGEDNPSESEKAEPDVMDTSVADTGIIEDAPEPPQDAPPFDVPSDEGSPATDEGTPPPDEEEPLPPTGPEPAYGVFQLYGLEYSGFRKDSQIQKEGYWKFVDEHVAELGVRFTRTNTLLIWGVIEEKLGEGYEWNGVMKTDEVLEATFAPKPGKEMDILVVIDPSRGQETPSFPTGNEAAYQEFVRAAVERYDGDGLDDAHEHVRVTHWQVMNEPVGKITHGWLTASEYANLARLTEAAVHEADPGARVLLGDLGPHMKDVLPLLNDGGPPFHAADVHFWGNINMYEMKNLTKIREGLDKSGHASAEIWMTEFGTHAGKPDKGPEQDQTDQARWLVKAMVSNRAQGVSRILWNNLVAWTAFKENPASVFNFMGLVSNGASSGDPVEDLGKKRLSYYAYERLIAATGTKHATLIGEVASVPEPARAFEFHRSETMTPVYVVWSDGTDTEVSLAFSDVEARVVGLVVGEDGVHPEQTVQSTDGLVTVTATADPAIVESP